MGNYSRDTFDRLKHYVNVRLQQGVPIVDADWNELQDIRKHELETFLKWFVGNGVPLGNDGFAIGTVDGANDFSIAAGHCLVEGWTVVNENGVRYQEQTEVPPLVTPSSDRTDTVYLDVWEREVNAEEAPEIVNPGIGIEACVRTKREWVVRVAEDATELPSPPPGHVFYPLARLDRKAGLDVINDDGVTDLRRTGLTLAGKVDRTGDRIAGDFAVNGHVGIGTMEPKFPVDCKGVIRALGPEGNPWPPPGPGLGVGVEILYVDWEQPNRGVIQAHDRDAKENKPLYIDCKTLALQSALGSGKVGIGTTNPAKNLHIQGRHGSAAIYNDANDRPGLAIVGGFPSVELFSEINNTSHGPTLRLGGYDDDTKTTFKHWVIGTSARNSFFLDFGFGTHPNPHSGIQSAYGGKTVMTLYQDGRVRAKTLELTGRTFRLGRPVWGADEQEASDRAIISSDGINTDLHPAHDGHGYVRVRDVNWPGGITFKCEGHSRINSFNDLRTFIPSTLYLQTEGGPVALPPGDYAEYFESLSGKEIPAGTSVALEDDRIRPAEQGETPIGVISANPGIVGGAYTEWPEKHLRGELGNIILEEYKEEVMAPKKAKVTRERQKMQKKTIEEEVTRTEIVLEDGKYLQKETAETATREVEEPVFEEVDLYDATGKTVIGKHRVPVMEPYEEEIHVLDGDGRPVLEGTGKFETKERPKLHPDYSESKEYVPRAERPEWNCVGLLGKLPLRKGQPVAESWIKMKDLSDEVELWLVK